MGDVAASIVNQMLGYGLPGIIIIVQFYVIIKLDQRATQRVDALAKLHDEYAAKDSTRTERLAVVISENTRSNDKVAESYIASASAMDRLVRAIELSTARKM